MKVPGKAWLQFEIIPQGETEVRLIQTALYEPDGLAGLLYWYVLYPIHSVIFRGMIAAIAHRAEISIHLQRKNIHLRSTIRIRDCPFSHFWS